VPGLDGSGRLQVILTEWRRREWNAFEDMNAILNAASHVA
jgi:hypothetical protein